jgi:hypothetical protein
MEEWKVKHCGTAIFEIVKFYAIGSHKEQAVDVHFLLGQGGKEKTLLFTYRY